MKSLVTVDIDLHADGKRSGSFRVPHSHDQSAYGGIPIPIVVAANGEGPTVLVTGGVHGDEYEGPLAIAALAREIDPAMLRGRVIMVPVVNWPAFSSAHRNSPIDGINLNRVFPGDPYGSVTEIVADFVEHHLLSEAAFAVDLHAGGLSLDYAPVLQLAAADPSSAEDALNRRIAKAFGTEFVLAWEPERIEHWMIGAAAKRNGAKWISAELGGGSRVSRGGLSLARDGLWRLLRVLGVLHDGGPTESGVSPGFVAANTTGYIYARSAGTFEPCCALGDKVAKGDLAALVHDLAAPSAEPQRIVWPRDGVVVCQRTLARVENGDCLGHLAW